MFPSRSAGDRVARADRDTATVDRNGQLAQLLRRAGVRSDVSAVDRQRARPQVAQVPNARVHHEAGQPPHLGRAGEQFAGQGEFLTAAVHHDDAARRSRFHGPRHPEDVAADAHGERGAQIRGSADRSRIAPDSVRAAAPPSATAVVSTWAKLRASWV